MTSVVRRDCTCPSGDGSLRWPCPQHPPLGAPDIPPRDADLIAELRGFAEGSTSARATLMRDAADAIERLALGQEARDDERDALAKAMCAVENRSKAASLEEVQAGIQRWTRHRYEADRLIDELADAGYEVRARKHPEPEITKATWDYAALVKEAEGLYGRAVEHDDVDYEVGLIQRLGLALHEAALRVPVGEGEQ
ncbi:hypothetical protein BKA24_001814 [Microbacterium marinum]|uniref:Uncharacterized protein n=1 Tax=Microbacterium marinum TaxID=421115 RepID=A0A7W7BQR3_9MICO|nr:hypothetical protein [Microbacterium marinum]MBB4667105.1 hypothetical protein [Microbacterium marinum]